MASVNATGLPLTSTKFAEPTIVFPSLSKALTVNTSLLGVPAFIVEANKLNVALLTTGLAVRFSVFKVFG